jgi:hypothetical protein
MGKSEISECEHAKRIREKGRKPNMAPRVFSLGETVEGNTVLLHVCIDCWRVLLGSILGEFVADVLRRELREHGLNNLVLDKQTDARAER